MSSKEICFTENMDHYNYYQDKLESRAYVKRTFKFTKTNLFLLFIVGVSAATNIVLKIQLESTTEHMNTEILRAEKESAARLELLKEYDALKTDLKELRTEKTEMKN